MWSGSGIGHMGLTPSAVHSPSRSRSLVVGRVTDRGLAEGWVTRQVERPPEPVSRQQPLRGTPTTTELISQDRGA